MRVTVICTLLLAIGLADGRMLGLSERCERGGREECGHGMECENYRCKATPMCYSESIRIRQDIESGRLQDADPGAIQCESDGNYKARQCGRTPFFPQTSCGCVDKYTGRRLRGYDMSFEPNMKPEHNMTCACAQRRAIYLRQGDYFPECEEKTGNFLPVRCGDKACACVDFYGTALKGYRSFRNGESKCLCARDKYAYSLLEIVGLTHNCDGLGQYESVQCTGSVCFCADERGQQRYDIPSVPIYRKNTLRC